MPTQDVNIRLRVAAGEAKKALDTLSGSINDVNKATKAIAKSSGLAFTVMAAGLTTAVVQAAKFDDQMRSVATLLDDNAFSSVGKDLNQGFADLKSGALQVLSEIPIQSEAATKSLFDLVSAGVDVTKANKALTVSGKLAVAGLTDVGVATDGITSALNAYGLSADEAEVVASKFFAAQKKGKTTIAELASGFGKVGATASSLGVSLDEVLSSVSTLTLGGIKTTEAYTSVNAILTGIAKPTAEAAKEAARLGINFDIATLKTKGLSGFLEQLTSNEKFTEDSATKLFGSVEALKGVFTLTGKGANKFKDILADIGDETKTVTTFNKAYEKQSKSLAKQTALFTNKIKSLVIQFGDRLSPIFSKIVQIGNDILDFFNGLSDVTKDLITGFAIVATAITGAIAAISGLALGIGSLIALWPTMVAGFTALTATVIPTMIGLFGVLTDAVIALGVAFLTNPIGIALAAIAVAAVALKVAWDENFLGIQEIAIGVWAAIKKAFDIFYNILLAAFNALKEALSPIITAISDFFSEKISAGAQIVGSVIGGIKDIFETVFTAIGEFIDPFVNAFVNAFNWISEAIGKAIDQFLKMSPVISFIIDKVKDFIGQLGDAYDKAASEHAAMLATQKEASKKDLQGELEDEKSYLRKRNAERTKALAEQNKKEAAKRKKAADEARKQQKKDEDAALKLREARLEKQLDFELQNIVEGELARAGSQDAIDEIQSQAMDVAEKQHQFRLKQIAAEKISAVEAVEKRKDAELDYEKTLQDIYDKTNKARDDQAKKDKENDDKRLKRQAEFIKNLKINLGDVALGISDAIKSALTGDIFGDIGKSISGIGGIPAQFAESAANLSKTIEDTAASASKAVSQIPGIANALARTFETVFPKLVKAFVRGIPVIVKALSKVAPIIVRAISRALPQVVRAVLQALPELIGLLPELFTELLSGLSKTFEVILQELPNIILALFDALPQLFKAIVDVIPSFVESFAENIGPIVEALVEGLVTATPEIIAALIDSLLLEGGLERIVGALIRAMPRIAVALAVGFAHAIGNLIQDIGGSFGKAFVGGLKLNTGGITTALGEAFMKALELYLTPLKAVFGVFGQFIDRFKGAVDSILSIPQKIKDAISSATGGLLGGGGGGGVFGKVVGGVKSVGSAIGFEKGTSYLKPRYAQNGLNFVTRAPSFPNRNSDTVDIKGAVGERIFSMPENRQIIDAMNKLANGDNEKVIHLKISPPEFARIVDQAIVENSVSGVGSVRVSVGSED